LNLENCEIVIAHFEVLIYVALSVRIETCMHPSGPTYRPKEVKTMFLVAAKGGTCTILGAAEGRQLVQGGRQGGGRGAAVEAALHSEGAALLF
jgi:hypothetical protein